MRLLFATKDLSLAGRSFEGFPLLIGKDGWPVEPVQSFLWHTLIEAGVYSSKLTWEAYGRRLYDYFAFLEANHLKWNEESLAPGLSVISRYVNWSVGELKLNSSTVNKRLGLIIRFYRWAKKNGYISSLPFGERRVSAVECYFHKADGVNGRVRMRASPLLRERAAIMQFLTKEQVQKCFAVKADPSHNLLFHLMVRAGLRSCEARTFPIKYVFNPRFRSGLRRGQMISVSLDPRDMHIKYDRPRAIDVPFTLMEKMWTYSLYHREGRNLNAAHDNKALILTGGGREFSKDAVVDVMRGYESRCGFYVRAHMLRHTYATYTLRALRKAQDFGGEPLLYIRDRLGHSDVSTTLVYLHMVNQLEAHSVLAHEDEIDEMFLADGL